MKNLLYTINLLIVNNSALQVSFYSLLPLIPQGDQKYWTLVRNDMLVLTTACGHGVIQFTGQQPVYCIYIEKTETDKEFILYMIHQQFIHDDS